MRFIGLDPSTKTGFVALDEHGTVLKQKELTGVGSVDPLRMLTMIDEVMDFMKRDDFICIEGFGFASQQAIQLGGIGWGIRMALARRGHKWYEVAPMALKKFAGATGNKGPDGKAIKADKIEVAKQTLKRWDFESGSDNITDAFLLAKIAEGIWHYTEGATFTYPKFQEDVIYNILNPKPKAKKTKKRRGA
ncbi:hypothetical protein [Fictibacillus nanhaiensis]|uniref:hypothetical protein n=1 Tax=Fictibacillus nanhaiensis TaxID=742169 RepID=UPI003C13D4B1